MSKRLTEPQRRVLEELRRGRNLTQLHRLVQIWLMTCTPWSVLTICGWPCRKASFNATGQKPVCSGCTSRAPLSERESQHAGGCK